ncbi:MAG: ABC transporter ATP-binding protein, partial [Candidatus Hydrogenedentes bacterium]|nr:ABC transporter ATP-binding protein [Candidatus Hydrogenedentota bacterium]
MPLLSVENLKTHFHTRNGVVRAVDGISLSVEKGQTLGIVGESGSGKSVSCYSLLGLIPSPPGRIEAGTALFDGADLLAMNQREIQAIRGRRISMIFQDPMTALNPYMSIGGQLTEPLRVHGKMPKSEAMDRAAEALKSVGILDGARRMKDFPHQYSGGMRQRVM